MSVTAETASRRRVTSPRYTHLARLSDRRGIFEHAAADVPRWEHGYCVDDVARGLLVVVREPDQTPRLRRLASSYLAFLAAAIEPDGSSRNRMSATGEWSDDAGTDDCWGRSLWGLGVAAALASDAGLRTASLHAFLLLAQQRSADVRSMAFAALGAGELVLAGNRDERVLSLLVDAVDRIPVLPTRDWSWPEDRLRYANGSLAEAVLLAGGALGDAGLAARGLSMLEALVRIESRGDHLSVTGAQGRGPRDTQAQFDQQPIEVAAIADGAARAYAFTAEARWLDVVERSWRWFLGDNDAGTAMVDLATGAGYDGLEPTGRNDNRGAESTLAALGTWQQARRLGVLGPAS